MSIFTPPILVQTSTSCLQEQTLPYPSRPLPRAQCLLPEFLCWNPNPQSPVLRVFRDVTFRKRLGPEGSALLNGLIHSCTNGLLDSWGLCGQGALSCLPAVLLCCHPPGHNTARGPLQTPGADVGGKLTEFQPPEL